MKRLPGHVGILVSAFTWSAKADEAAPPSEDEFMQARLTAPQDRSIKEMCGCATREAKTNVSTIFHRAMVLDMKGRQQEAEASLGDMSPLEERATCAERHFPILGKRLPD